MGHFIVIAGGGTGGHVFPGLAVAAELRRRDPSGEILFLGSEKGLETRLVPAAGFALRTLRLGGLAGKTASAAALSAWRATLAVVRCLGMFLRRRPAAVVGVGGFASGPAVLAALLLRVPTLIHEQNATPGLTNRWLAPFVDEIAVSFPGTETVLRGRGAVTGNPIRAEFFAIPPYAGPGARLRVLIFGGSRGARALNQAAAAALARLAPAKQRLAIVHQTGEADLAATRDAYARSGLEATVLPFLDDMPARLAAADLVICRSGAGTVFELAAAGRASILVPYPLAAGRHQEKNARWMAAAGAAEVVLNQDLTGERLATLIEGALAAPQVLVSRAAAARALARPDAAAAIASMTEGLAGGSR